MLNEPEVLLKTHNFLRSERLWQQPVVRLYTDAHTTLLPYKALSPFQRFTLNMGDFVLHPDLVGQLGDGETIFAVEAKGSTDLIKGLAQAEMYQMGFHCSFLAADASALGTSLVDFARRKNIGIITVGDSVTIAHLPSVGIPLRDKFQFIARQIEGVLQIAGRQTFSFNIPTHYLVWAIALESNQSYQMAELPKLLGNYPIPTDWKSALMGAQKLGIVRLLGDRVSLTNVGSAVKDILPQSVHKWTDVHNIVGARRRGVPLVDYLPQAAAVLRLLLMYDLVVRIVVEGLETFPDHTASFAHLAAACDQLDHARAPIFFLKPEAIPLVTDDKDKIHWEYVKSEYYRSTTFHQYKSILKHAGILANLPLGTPSSRGYDPHRDIWQLR